MVYVVYCGERTAEELVGTEGSVGTGFFSPGGETPLLRTTVKSAPKRNAGGEHREF